jgi:hypothetical protein
MIGLIWNSRGLGKTGKIPQIVDMLQNIKLTLWGCKKTKKEDFYDACINMLASNSDFVCFVSPVIIY